jgi:hypothetical protein
MCGRTLLAARSVQSALRVAIRRPAPVLESRRQGVVDAGSRRTTKML